MTNARLLDTSVLTRLHVQAVRVEIDRHAAGGLARCSISDLELGYSARNLREWKLIQSALSDLAVVPVDGSVIARAKQVQRDLASRRLRGRKVPDLIIAAAAELAGLEVLHYDADFEVIASVTAQSHEWVVPRGSID